ncbi:MAG: glutathione S-transferase N-terminal domain-containing protein [Alphaproteobacteria bacterium]
MAAQPVTMYEMMVSGHTARTRRYFIKADIPFYERAPSTEHYLKTVVPLAGGLRTMPTFEFPDGRVIRDSTAIIDHFEDQSGHPFSPTTPKQRFFSRRGRPGGAVAVRHALSLEL